MTSLHPSRTRATVALSLLWLAPVTSVLAVGSEEGVRALGESAATPPLATLLRLVVALGVVLLAFWGCARLMRRLDGGIGGGAAKAGLRVVGALSLGHRERLVLVQAGGEQLLLGVTANRIERLHLLPHPLAGRQEQEPSGGGDGDFRARLLAATRRQVTS